MAARVFVVSSAGPSVRHRLGSKLIAPFSFDAGDEGLARCEGLR